VDAPIVRVAHNAPAAKQQSGRLRCPPLADGKGGRHGSTGAALLPRALRLLQGARTRGLLLFLALLACYTYFLPRWADWNQNSRFDLVLALVEEGTARIDRHVANTGDYAYYGGHYYSDKAPGLALLGVPVYASLRGFIPGTVAAGMGAASDNPAIISTLREGASSVEPDRMDYFAGLVIVTLFVVALPSAALGLIFLRMATLFGCPEKQALLATLLYCVATSAFAYANAFVGHQTSALLLFGAFALLFGIRRRVLGSYWLLLVGFLLGYAVITEYPTALIAGLLGLYGLWTLGRPLRVGLYLLVGAVPPLVMLAAYDYAAFGTPLPVGYAYSSLWSNVHSVGFMSLTYPQAEALWGITFGAHRGLFFLSPYLLLALPGYFVLWRQKALRPEFWILLLAPISFLLFNGSSVMWQGGFAVGPRYLVPALPFLALAAAIGLAWAWQRLALRLAVSLAGAWSLLAVWAETIAGQSFPDYTPNPLFDLSLPRLAAGDVARNAGMFLGLAGWASLLPLLAVELPALILVLLSFSARLPRRRGGPSIEGSRPEWASR